MTTNFLDALTHNGPGYELPRNELSDEPRSRLSRFLDALTHSGPGYDLDGEPEATEISHLKREKMKALYDLLLESLELNLYALGNLEAARRESDSRDREILIQSATERLRAYLDITGQPLQIALSSARESLGPLDIRAKVNLRKLQRLTIRSRASVRSTLDSATPSSQRASSIPLVPQIAVKRASRSVEAICHAGAR
jgi:hypothetical protein